MHRLSDHNINSTFIEEQTKEQKEDDNDGHKKFQNDEERSDSTGLAAQRSIRVSSDYGLDSSLHFRLSRHRISTVFQIPARTPASKYHLMRENVPTKIIQLGLTLSDRHGNLPDLGTDTCYIWEFNFRDFDIDRDCQNKDSTELLRGKESISWRTSKRVLALPTSLLC